MTDQSPNPERREIARWLLMALVAALVAVSIPFVVKRLGGSGGAAPDRSAQIIGGPFTLTDHTGARVTEADFLGRPMLVYFGFTYCPDVCPTTLQVEAAALEQLGADADLFQPILITVDPERDSAQALAAYVASPGFPENLVGLTGSVEDIEAAEQAYRVYAEKTQPQGYADYLVDHTSVLYLMDEKGRFVEPFGHGATPDDIAAGLERFLREWRARGGPEPQS